MNERRANRFIEPFIKRPFIITWAGVDGGFEEETRRRRDHRAVNPWSSIGATGIGKVKAMDHRSHALDSSLSGGHRGVFGLELDGAANGFRGECHPFPGPSPHGGRVLEGKPAFQGALFLPLEMGELSAIKKTNARQGHMLKTSAQTK